MVQRMALPFFYAVKYNFSYVKIIRTIRVNYCFKLHETCTALMHQCLRMRSSIHSVSFLGGWNGTESIITEATIGLLYQPRMMSVEQSVE
jgi:hypothetical protein